MVFALRHVKRKYLGLKKITYVSFQSDRLSVMHEKREDGYQLLVNLDAKKIEYSLKKTSQVYSNSSFISFILYILEKSFFVNI